MDGAIEQEVIVIDLRQGDPAFLEVPAQGVLPVVTAQMLAETVIGGRGVWAALIPRPPGMRRDVSPCARMRQT